MADLPQQFTIKQYEADGSTTVYVYNYLVPLSSDIAVYLTPVGQNPDPAADIQILNSDYTVQGTGNTNGGTVTFVVAPAAGVIVTLSRAVEASIDTNFANASTFKGINLDNAFERVTLVAQQNQTYALQRNLSYRVNTYFPDDSTISQFTQLPLLDPGQIWYGGSTGVLAVTLEEGADTSVLRSELANEDPGTNGATIVGYYDPFHSTQTTVAAFLDNIETFINGLGVSFKPGMLLDYAGGTVPSGWLPCDGAAISRVDYAALFAAIGTTWGVGDGTTTFNVPNLQRRVTLGSGGSATSPNFAGTTVGSFGGEEVHTQTIPELAAHTHTYDRLTLPVGGVSFAGGAGYGETYVPTASTSVGSSTAMNNMQLGAVVTKIIKI